MQVKAHDKVIDLQVTTVTLGHDLTDPQGYHVYMFHCPKCGSPVAQYSGFVVALFPGMAPVKLPVITKCTNERCTAKYLFHSVV